MRRLLACLAVAAAACTNLVEGHGRAGGPNAGVEEPLPPPPRAVLMDGGPSVRVWEGGVSTGLACFFRDVLPADCNLAGAWRLLHSQPDGVCPFGASRHDIRLTEEGGSCASSPGRTSS
jgi:hypothetical protein